MITHSSIHQLQLTTSPLGVDAKSAALLDPPQLCVVDFACTRFGSTRHRGLAGGALPAHTKHDAGAPMHIRYKDTSQLKLLVSDSVICV